MKTLLLSLAALAVSMPAAADQFSDATGQTATKFKKAPSAKLSSSQASDLGAQIRALNASSVGGPSPSAADAQAGDNSDSPRPGFLAAVDYIADGGRAVCQASFAKYLERRASAGGVEGPQEDDFRIARESIRRLVLAPAGTDKEHQISVKAMSARDGDVGSAYWQVYVTDGKTSGGEVGLAARPRDKISASGPDDREYQRLKAIDNWANSVIHEALHVYYSAFISRGFTEKSTTDKYDVCFGQTVFAMGARPGVVCGPGRACPQVYRTYTDPRKPGSGSECYKPCGDPQMCYSWAIPGKDMDGPTEIIARRAALDMTEASQGQALKKIVDAGR